MRLIASRKQPVTKQNIIRIICPALEEALKEENIVSAFARTGAYPTRTTEFKKFNCSWPVELEWPNVCKTIVQAVSLPEFRLADQQHLEPALIEYIKALSSAPKVDAKNPTHPPRLVHPSFHSLSELVAPASSSLPLPDGTFAARLDPAKRLLIMAAVNRSSLVLPIDPPPQVKWKSFD